MARGTGGVRGAVVTGAGRGIGAAVAARLQTAGFRVFLGDIDETAAHLSVRM
ncbi:MAG: SDR family NAD(P)-dependent oxidoreductase [Pseudonocardiaceae bacterium]